MGISSFKICHMGEHKGRGYLNCKRNSIKISSINLHKKHEKALFFSKRSYHMRERKDWGCLNCKRNSIKISSRNHHKKHLKAPLGPAFFSATGHDELRDVVLPSLKTSFLHEKTGQWDHFRQIQKRESSGGRAAWAAFSLPKSGRGGRRPPTLTWRPSADRRRARARARARAKYKIFFIFLFIYIPFLQIKPYFSDIFQLFGPF